VPWIGDLAHREACDKLLALAGSTLGHISHFVHSAAPARREADHALAVSDEIWERMRAINVDAGFHLAREIARPLIAAREPGSFLMLTSLHVDTPRNLPHCSAAKAALAMLVKELAKTPGRFGIRVNALVPFTRLSPSQVSSKIFVRSYVGVDFSQVRSTLGSSLCRGYVPGRRRASKSFTLCRMSDTKMQYLMLIHRNEAAAAQERDDLSVIYR